MGVYGFLKGISQKVKVMARLEFELAYFEVAVQHFSHYTMETHPYEYCHICLSVCPATQRMQHGIKFFGDDRSEGNDKIC